MRRVGRDHLPLLGLVVSPVRDCGFGIVHVQAVPWLELANPEIDPQLNDGRARDLHLGRGPDSHLAEVENGLQGFGPAGAEVDDSVRVAARVREPGISTIDGDSAGVIGFEPNSPETTPHDSVPVFGRARDEVILSVSRGDPQLYIADLHRARLAVLASVKRREPGQGPRHDGESEPVLDIALLHVKRDLRDQLAVLTGVTRVALHWRDDHGPSVFLDFDLGRGVPGRVFFDILDVLGGLLNFLVAGVTPRDVGPPVFFFVRAAVLVRTHVVVDVNVGRGNVQRRRNFHPTDLATGRKGGQERDGSDVTNVHGTSPQRCRRKRLVNPSWKDCCFLLERGRGFIRLPTHGFTQTNLCWCKTLERIGVI